MKHYRKMPQEGKWDLRDRAGLNHHERPEEFATPKSQRNKDNERMY